MSSFTCVLAVFFNHLAIVNVLLPTQKGRSAHSFRLFLSMASLLIAAAKPSGKTINHAHIFFSGQGFNLKLFTKHDNNKQMSHASSLCPLRVWEPALEELCLKSHPAFSLKLQLLLAKQCETKGPRVRCKSNLGQAPHVGICCKKCQNCQCYCALTALLQRRRHMQAQLVEACPLNPTSSFTDLLVWRRSQPEERHAGRKRLPEVALGYADCGASRPHT